MLKNERTSKTTGQRKEELPAEAKKYGTGKTTLRV